MATATKLKSGAYRTFGNKRIHGKLVRKSFTVHPKEFGGDWRKAKSKSELLAREWQLAKEESIINGKTVKEAIEEYISDKSKVLSPTTIIGYKKIFKAFEPIENYYISELDTPTIQKLVNEWSETRKSKTITNRIGLLMSVLNYLEIDKKFKIKYKKELSKVKSPDLNIVKALIEGAPMKFKPVLYLAAFGSLRRGEIAGLREKDISRKTNTITVNGDMIWTESGWIYKPIPKTEGSARSVELPPFVIESLPLAQSPDDFIFKITPNDMTDRTRRLAHKLGLRCTLHSLRHFAASFRTDLGIPRKYVEEVGGWESGSTILPRVYDNALDSSREKYTKIANEFIEQNFN